MLKLRKYKSKIKYDTNELIYDMETDSQTQRTDSLPRGKGGGGLDQEFRLTNAKYYAQDG